MELTTVGYIGTEAGAMVEAPRAVRARVGVGEAVIQRDTHAVPGSFTRGTAPHHAQLVDAVHTPIRASEIGRAHV